MLPYTIGQAQMGHLGHMGGLYREACLMVYDSDTGGIRSEVLCVMVDLLREAWIIIPWKQFREGLVDRYWDGQC